MDKHRIYIFIFIALFFAIIGALFHHYFEIYQHQRYIPPSREVSSNSFYAMEQWLKETGYNVRIEEHFFPGILRTAEKVVIASSGTICHCDTEEIIEWIQQGNFLIITLSHNTNDNHHLYGFLADFGITVEYSVPTHFFEEELIDFFSHADFQARISFLVEFRDDVTYIHDLFGIIRLVEVSKGNGALTVIGLPLFMYNFNIEKEVNAALAWQLTGGRFSAQSGSNNGVLFIRSSNQRVQRSMFGAIMQRGNLVPIIISSLLLIFVGFWAVIPVFGLTAVEKQRTSRPIKDRFIAEIRFLKKHNALNYYLDVYERELTTASSKTEKTYNYNELINKYRRIFDETTKS